MGASWQGAFAARPAAAAPADAAFAPVGKQEEESVAIFQKNWQAYQKMLLVDFLEHRLLYGALQEQLLTLFGNAGNAGSSAGDTGSSSTGGIAMLDLGCGDALQIAKTLQRCGCPAGTLRLSSYTGVDLSAPALQLAAEHLGFLQPACAVQLVEQDMTVYVAAYPGDSFDLAFASFAVHHLSTLQAKADFLAQVARCLKPGGVFALADVFRQEGECREVYMDRYRANMAEAVATGIIEPAEADLLLNHITNFDYPEQLSELQAVAPAAGFAGGAQCVVTDSKAFGRLVLLRKAEPAAAQQ